MRYIRTADRREVTRAEACTPTGSVRIGFAAMMDDGEAVGFSAAFADSVGSGRRLSFTDSAPTLTDAETSRAVALAERNHRIRHAYLGDRAPAFSADQRERAIRDAASVKATTTLTDHAAGIRDAETATALAMRDEAAARRKVEIRNAWRR